MTQTAVSIGGFMYFDSVILASIIVIVATTAVVGMFVYYGYKHIANDIKTQPKQ